MTVRVSNITMHPDWSSESDSYDADIAIVTTKTKFKLSTYAIVPINLPLPHDTQIKNAKMGTIAGWGERRAVTEV